MMERRTFVKGSVAGSLMLFVEPASLLRAAAPAAADSLDDAFLRPPASARPHTWWHWMNGNVTADGITRDLEAMARVGVGGVQMFDVGTGIPKGPVETLSPEWLRLVRHAMSECDRLGISFTMHNCPGWSSSGGPWVTPDRAMQQLTWSETVVEGGRRLDQMLPKPYAKIGYYRDALVVAYPSLPGEATASEQPQPRVTVSGAPSLPPVAASNASSRNIATTSPAPAGSESVVLTDWDLSAGVDVRPVAQGQLGYLTYEFTTPAEVRSVIVHAVNLPSVPGTGGSAPLRLEASDDGVSFRLVADLAGGASGAAAPNVPLVATFAAVRAKFFRLALAQAYRITEFRVSAVARISDWPAKTNLARQRNQDARPTAIAGAAIDPETVVDVTRFLRPDGTLTWDVPAGRWTILRIGHTPTARMQNAASDAGQGLEIDKFSAEAMTFHFDQYFGKLYQAIAPLAKKGRVGALVDSYEVGMQNWTPSFPSEFRTRRGYDLMKYMPAMTGRVVGDAETTERFLWDVRRAQADVIADNYYGTFAALCARHGIKSYTEPYGPNNGPFDELQVGAVVDEPMGEFWIRQAGAQWGWSLKLGSSIAHVWDKPLVGAETFTGRADNSKWQESPYATKAIGDLMFTRGLNHCIFHRFAHQPHPDAAPGMTMGPWGFHFDRTNTWFEHAGPWLQYLARAQHMLRQGEFVADLLYVNAELAPSEMPDNANETKAPLVPAPPDGHDYDVIHARALMSRARMERGRVSVKGGMTYRVLVLQPTGGMTVELARTLRTLVRDGAWLVGAPPSYSLGLRNAATHDRELRDIVAELWGTDGASARDVGKGRVFRPQPLRDVLGQLGVTPDAEFTGTASDRDVRYIHRRAGNSDIYFVTNHLRRTEEIVASFRVANKRPEIFDPMTGAIHPMPVYDATDGRVRVPLRLAPSGSLFVVFRAPSAPGALRSIASGGQVILTAAPMAAPPMDASRSVRGTFTISAWVKPEIELTPGVGDFAGGSFVRESTEGTFGDRTSNFVVHPPDGALLYGDGHTAVGFTAGRNGIVVYERGRELFAPVAAAAVPIAGWTHVAIVYRDGTPVVYVGGVERRTGLRGGRITHPGTGAPDANLRFVHFEGDNTTPEVFAEALDAGRIAQLASVLPTPDMPPACEAAAVSTPSLMVWRNGEFQLTAARGRTTTIFVTGLPAPAEIEGPWRVSFQPNRGAPSDIMLPRLMSLHEHELPGVRYFSGTASYSADVTQPAPANRRQRIVLDLGRVEVLAEVFVNGRAIGAVWKPPYRIDITSAMRAGRNALEVRVTNLWPNRLIGDEELPEENLYGPASGPPRTGSTQGTQNAIREMPGWYMQGQPRPPGARIAFTTWKHHRRGDPLLASGLLGPVRIFVGERIGLRA